MSIIATLAIAGAAVNPTVDLPAPDAGECVIHVVDVALSDPTFISDAEAEGLTLIVVCGYKVPGTEPGSTRLERQMFNVDVDLETAEVIVDAAGELLEDDNAPQ